MEKFFAVFGRFALIILVFALLAGGGYYIGRSGKLSFGSLQPAPEAATTVNPTTTPVVSPMPATKTVSAGTPPDSGLSFSQYTVEIPSDWTSSHTYENVGTPVDTLTISKDGNEIKIWQAATGGAICLFPEDTPFEGPSSSYTTFVEFTGTEGIVFRRSSTAGGKHYTVCQKSSSYGTFQLPTGFGHVSYTTTATPDDAILTIMDGIIASLQKS